jgi:tRNA-splicing endonuclease subunit Sen2
MGFFGKGSLSRSEPTWLEQEKKRKGILGGMTSEEVTRQRRAERRDLKLQRARSEKLIIDQRLQAEAAAREGRTSTDTPSDLSSSAGGVTIGAVLTAEKFSVKKAREARFLEARQLARQDKDASGKIVQFSTTADDSGTMSRSGDLAINGHESLEEITVEDKEHLQLSNEEAFFLVYGLGALHIFDREKKSVLSPSALLTLFCHHSYSPPRELSVDLKTDDPFLVSYVVYHHFRSLGWVVRSGVKFGVDYIIYNRGPVFSHAEFAVVIIPSYDHPYWSETEGRKAECAGKQARSWWWFHCVNRVQAQVKKTLVACYVEVPPPSQNLEAALAGSIDIGALLGRYTVRELIIRRWIPNRSRD